jgi:hypothetical protein
VKTPPGAEWMAIMTYNSLAAEEKEKRAKEKLLSEKIQFKKSLDEQINKAKHSKSSEKIDDKKFAERIYKDVEQFHTEEQQKLMMSRKRYQDELELQKLQIVENKQRQLAERDELKRIEELNIVIAKERLAKEAEKVRLQKEKEAELRRFVERENEENNRLHELEKQRAAEEDQRLMKEYAAKLDRDFEVRESSFKKKMDEMSHKGNKFETEGAGKAAREKKHKEDMLLLKEQQRKEELEHLKDLKKEEERKLRTQKALDENNRQLEEKKKALEEEKVRGLSLKVRFESDMEEYLQSQKEKARRDRESRLQYQEVLSKQVEETSKIDRNLTGISDKEKELNKSVLNKIHEDPLMMSRVLHRVRVGKAANKN